MVGYPIGSKGSPDPRLLRGAANPRISYSGNMALDLVLEEVIRCGVLKHLAYPDLLV